MTIGKGRVVQPGTPMDPAWAPTVPSQKTLGPRFVPPEAMALLDRAQDLVQDAEKQARQILGQAQASRKKWFEEEMTRAREQAELALAAKRLELERQIALADEKQLERSVQLARILAERIVRRQIEHEPEWLLSMARSALENFRRARHTQLFVHHDHVQPLQQALPAMGFPAGSISVHGVDMPLGELRVVSDLGELSFSVASQLDRLVEALGVTSPGSR